MTLKEYRRQVFHNVSLSQAKAWEANSEKFCFCADLLEVSAQHDISFTLVDRLEAKFEKLLKSANTVTG